MAISNAVSLANFTSGDALTVDSANDRVGVASTTPSSGTQRVVVTSQTSGTMTASGTNADLTYNTTSNTLSATTFSGSLTGNVTGNVTGNISGATGDFTGNVSVGGTLTYEDVTNVDSVGLITARSGVIISGSGIGLSVTEGGARVTGVVTATSFSGDGSNLSGIDSTFDTWLYG